MKLELDASAGDGYPSASQWARRVTEAWAIENLYCLACSSNSLSAHVANRAVEDYHCARCRRQVQLKAKNGPLGRSVSNSAYAKKVQAIQAGRAPDYCFMTYSRSELLVRNVLWVPGHFMTLSVVSKRPPLGSHARRAGWVGSNIHLDRIPESGKLSLVDEGRILPVKQVRAQFRQLEFLRTFDAEGRGWLADIVASLDKLGIHVGSSFTNDDIYSDETRLSQLHPNNQNVRPKIRQQLQVLVAHGVIQRTRPGNYRRL